VNPRLRVALAAATTFLAGFGAAELTGVRAIGGLVLLAGGAWCVRAAVRIAGAGPAIALACVALVAFVLSHPLGHVIGAWAAVLVSAGVVALATVALLRRPSDGGGEGLARPSDAQARREPV
jgi:hypothetical protein